MTTAVVGNVRVSEVAPDTFQFTTHIAEMNFSVSQYLVQGDEPFLFHTGMRSLFPSVSAAVASVMPLDRLRWVSFGHVEADECGSLNDWLRDAPQASVVQGQVGCMVSIADLADREPQALSDREVLDIGGHRIQWIDTPHVPHAWEAGLVFDETTRVLFCGDLFTQMGDFPPATRDDIVGPAIAAEEAFPGSALHPATGSILRGLADLGVDTLAPMHGPAFSGDCAAALNGLADAYDRWGASVLV